MATLTLFKVHNDDGQDLADNYLKPLCQQLGLNLRESKPDDDRGDALAYAAASDLVVWDCSVESGQVYNAFNMWAKTPPYKKHVIVSRTPLPRNVLTHYQCAPTHGKTFSNAELGEWLRIQIPAILKGHYSSQNYQNTILARHYWMRENPAEYFLSFRGSFEREACEWKKRFERENQTTVRMVPKREYSYETECVTQQQMWEGVARLMHEMRATGRVLIFLTEDYFDSFWTASEFLTALWMKGIDPATGKPMLDEVYFIRDWNSTQLQSIRDGMLDLKIPNLQGLMDRFVKLINNGDPFTSAPETQIPPTGLAKLVKLFVQNLGYYDPEFTTPSFWNTVRVPCPVCKPKGRKPHEVDWQRHMSLPDDTRQSDYFGYFPVQPHELESGQVQCPHGHPPLRLVNQHGVRTLWVPVLTTEKDKGRPAIQAHKIWEVVLDNPPPDSACTDDG
jgi:hypothetical protein